MTRTILLFAAALGLATAALAQPLGAQPPKPPPAAATTPGDLPEGAGKTIVQMACLQCHGLDTITAQSHSRDAWVDTVSRMIGNGAQLNDDEYALVIDYLTQFYGPKGAGAPARATPAN